MDGIDYKTTDVTKWGAGSGAGTAGNLSPLQLDLNFWELYSRLKNLEDNPPTAINITGMTVVGSQWEVNMSDGSSFGPFTLPIATFELKGDWVNDMTYYELDMVSAPGFGLYLVRIQHVTPPAPATFDPAATDDDDNPLYLLLYGENTYIYDLGFFFPGRPGIGIEDGAAIAGHVLVHPVTALTGLPGSIAKLKVAPASDLSFSIEHDDVEIGSVDFEAGDADGTFTFLADIDLPVDAVLTLMKPAAVDVDARELKVTFKMTRVI